MAVTDLQIDFDQAWHEVDLDAKTGRGWAKSLGKALGTDRATGKALVTQLADLRDSIRRTAAPGQVAAAWVPAPETGRVEGFVGFGLHVIDDTDGPEQYRGYLEADGSDGASADPALRVVEVRVWESEIDAGRVVGAYNLVEHHEPGADTLQMKVSTVICVFPPRSKEMVELVFCASRPDSFDDIVRDTMAIVSTMRVELEAF